MFPIQKQEMECDERGLLRCNGATNGEPRGKEKNPADVNGSLAVKSSETIDVNGELR